MFSLYVGYVSGTTDEYDAGRIKCIIPSDKGTAYKNIPYAFPALPKMVHVVPKDGEAVLVLVSNDKQANGQRYYIGPIISQPDKMGHDDFFSLSPTRFLKGGILKASKSLKNKGNTEGALPKEDEIAILGRKNTDIILSDDDVRIRAGVRLTKPQKRTVELNRDAPAYIKLKHYDPILKEEGVGKTGETQSTATIVADKINLISQNGKEYFNTSDVDEGINDKTMQEIFEKAQRLPYGEELCDFLSLLLKMYVAHSHPYPGMPPIMGDPESLAFFNKYGTEKDTIADKILNDNVRMN